ncbi:AAA family ATPase [Aliarcobacter butzleri]|uniref:AAA family ATPase n=1 Tax=Aliarcobacter butzleri TaxID=28197 RepID=UPI0012F8DF29|nr:ATP-binding protein [Aliarcobacter butzleri]
MGRIARRKSSQNIIEYFDIEQYASKELVDKFKLWSLRILVNLRGINEFIDKDNDIRNEVLAYFLAMQEFIKKEDFTKKEGLAFLRDELKKYENRKRFTTNKILKNNIEKISKLADLNSYEKDILEFAILLDEYEILQDVTSYIGGSLTINQTKKALSVILDIPLKEVDRCFAPNSKLSKSSLLIIDYYGTDLNRRLEFITDRFPSKMFSTCENIEDMIKEIVSECDNTDLTLNDFAHLNKELSILIPYLKNAITTNKRGVNILFHGVPGTGKTELTKVLANELKKSLYEVSYSDNNDEPIDGRKRLEAYKSAQALLSNKDIFLMFDEVEDVFNNDENPFTKRQQNKAWINRTLENNVIPTIWITNDVYSIDNAIIRRFDMTIEVPIPTKSKRVEIINKFSQNQLSIDAISKLASNETIAPALISRASKVISSLDKLENKDKAFEMIIDNTLKAQGYEGIKDNSSILLPKTYNPKYINCDMDLEKLTNGISKSQNARICLYGVAGTGKSAYGKYIAEKLEKPLILKKGSDLLGMFVGQTEKNIARAFQEAKEENAVLVFDEVDSFLADRNNANRSWEVTQVNEMLVQMESFDGIFIATTNLMNNLDSASLRRFDLKMEFGYLKSEQSWELFKHECKNIALDNISRVKKEVESISNLTPGDFAAVLRQNRFNPIEDSIDFYERLKKEVEVKNIDTSKKMGFIGGR